MTASMISALERDEALARDLAAVAGRVRRSTVDVVGYRGLGSGSGVIWSDDGLIITNAHVVGSRRMVISSWDGRVRSALLVARDAAHDLAALHMEPSESPAAAVREASPLRVGELVFAVGTPLGISGAVTAGIVHAPSAIGPGGQRWIRADLRLAPGNSGGPLADAQGRVVGINSMIVAGMAIAIPSEVVQWFVRDVARPLLDESVRRPHGEGPRVEAA